MRKIAVSLLMIVLAGLMILSGCGEDKLKPYFTRLTTSVDCGVAPLEVEFLAIVTGGTESSDPTGANMWYEISWDFDDGHTAAGSQAFNTFADPGEYEVSVVARDDDGDEAVSQTTIRVIADTLQVEALSEPPSGATITAGEDTVHLEMRAIACGLDTENDADYTRFSVTWRHDGNAIASGHLADYVFDGALVDTQWVHLTVNYPALSVVRTDSLFYILAPPTP